MIQSAPLLRLDLRSHLSTSSHFSSTELTSPPATLSPLPKSPNPGSYVTVKRVWLQDFLEGLPHNPYPGPGDSPPLRKLRPDDIGADDEVVLLSSDMQLAASRLPGHSFARNRLIKQLKGRDTTSSMAGLINAAVDSSGFYTGQQVVNMLERQHEEEEGRLRRSDHAEAEAASGRMLLADTLTGRVNAAILIQRAFRAFSRRRRLSEWFNSDNNATAFQQSHLSDRVWTAKSRRLAPSAHPSYWIEEKARALQPSPEDEEDEVSQPIPAKPAERKFNRRAFGTTFASRVLDSPDAEGVHIHKGSVSMRQRGISWGNVMCNEVWISEEERNERSARRPEDAKLLRLPSWGNELGQQQPRGEEGIRRRVSYTCNDEDQRPLQGCDSQQSAFTPRTSCNSGAYPDTPQTLTAAPSGAATPERQDTWGEGSDCSRSRSELSPNSSSFLPPIQSSSAMMRIMRMRSARASSRQVVSMSGIEGLASKPGSNSSSCSSVNALSPQASDAKQQSPPPADLPSRQSMPGTGSDSASSPPGSRAGHGSILDVLAAAMQPGLGSECSSERLASRSSCSSWQGGATPGSTPAKRGGQEPAAALRKGRQSMQGSPSQDAQTAGTAIVMHGTVHNPRKPSRLSCAPALAAAEKELRAGRAAHPPAPPGGPDSGLNPRALFLKWKEEERKRVELRNAMDPAAAQLGDEGQGETFVSYMQRSMQTTTGSKSFS